MEKVSESINHNCNHFHPEIKQSKSHTIQPSTGLVRMYLLMKVSIKMIPPCVMVGGLNPFEKYQSRSGDDNKKCLSCHHLVPSEAPSCLSTYSALKAVRKWRANSSSTGPEAKVVGFSPGRFADSPGRWTARLVYLQPSPMKRKELFELFTNQTPWFLQNVKGLRGVLVLVKQVLFPGGKCLISWTILVYLSRSLWFQNLECFSWCIFGGWKNPCL